MADGALWYYPTTVRRYDPRFPTFLTESLRNMTPPGRSSGSPHLAVAFPEYSSDIMTAGLRGLQLRGQLRFFTGFP